MRASALLSNRIIGDGATSADGPAKPAATVTASEAARQRCPALPNALSAAMQVADYEKGHFVGATVLRNVPPGGDVFKTEIFGPVLGLVHVDTIDEAIALVNSAEYGNMACVFTSSGAAARKFRYEAEVGNIGINIGVAAPMAFFPFSGWKSSFFGDMHGQGRDAIEFFTQKKVVVERWPKDWKRRF